MSNTNSTTTTWDAELITIRDRIYAEMRQKRGDFTLQDAAKCAIAELARQEPTQPAPTPAMNKAEWYISSGVQVRAVRNGWLIPSGTRATIIHRVSQDGRCSCEAGLSDKGCWHIEAVKLSTQRRAA